MRVGGERQNPGDVEAAKALAEKIMAAVREATAEQGVRNPRTGVIVATGFVLALANLAKAAPITFAAIKTAICRG